VEIGELKKISTITKYALMIKKEEGELKMLKLSAALEERKLLSYSLPHLLSDKGIIKELEREYRIMFNTDAIRGYVEKYWYCLFREVFKEVKIRELNRNLRAITRKEVQKGLKNYYTRMKFEQTTLKMTEVKRNYRLSPIYLVTKSVLKSSKRSPYAGYPFFFVLFKKLFPLIVHLYKISNIPIEKVDVDRCLKTILYFTRESILDFLSDAPEDRLQEQNLQEIVLPEELFGEFLPPKIEEIETLLHVYLFLTNWKPDRFYESCSLALKEIKIAKNDSNGQE